MVVSVSNLEKAFGGQTLFEGVTLSLNPGNRYGVVGANGSGKSTFLRVLMGREGANDGAISIPRTTRVGFLDQDRNLNAKMPIIHVAMMGQTEAFSALMERDRMVDEADDNFDAERFAELESTLERLGGHSLESQAGEILEGLGIPAAKHKESLAVLSGGFRLRALLAQVLVARPDLLLLDEPTNHLDIFSIRWLETFLDAYEGTAVIVSHDHRFLENTCNHILDVDYQTITDYTGS
jgi:ATPase subunit of ABC transporter with duplicated ATPase domains